MRYFSGWQLDAYFKRLEELNAQELDHSAGRVAFEERRNSALLIAHLAEMARRPQVVLALGYQGLYDYCQRRLRLSEGSIWLRVQVARVARRFPQLLMALLTKRVCLTVAGLLAPYLREENVEILLNRCSGKRKREVEEILVELRERKVFEPSLRRRDEGTEGCGRGGLPVSSSRPGRRSTTSASRRTGSSATSSSAWRKCSGSGTR
jgi:hypothetical protein